MISLRLKFNSRWKRVFCLLQRNIKLYHTTLKIKTANTAYSMLFANFFFTRVAKYLKDNKCNSLSFARKHVQIFFVGHYLFLKDHSFLDLRSWKTVGILKQIVSANKYPIIFSRLIKAIVFALPSRLVTNTAWKKHLNDKCSFIGTRITNFFRKRRTNFQWVNPRYCCSFSSNNL